MKHELSFEAGWAAGLASARSPIGVPRGDCGPVDFVLRHGAAVDGGGEECLRGFVAARSLLETGAFTSRKDVDHEPKRASD